MQLLGAAVGNCLSDSLLFALRKFKQAPEPIRCEVMSEGRLRVLGIQAVLTLGVPAVSLTHLGIACWTRSRPSARSRSA